MLRVRLVLPEGYHQFVNVNLAGVRCPRTASKQGEAAEQWAEEVGRVTVVCSYVVLTEPSIGKSFHRNAAIATTRTC